MDLMASKSSKMCTASLSEVHARYFDDLWNLMQTMSACLAPRRTSWTSWPLTVLKTLMVVPLLDAVASSDPS